VTIVGTKVEIVGFNDKLENTLIIS